VKPYYEHSGITIYHGDCREIIPTLDPVHAIITDPPYGLEFMGKEWDAPWKTDRRQNFDGTLQDQRENPYGRSKVRNGTGASYGADARIMQEFQKWCEMWAVECLRVLRPGGHMLSFGGSRTYHRMACAIEDAGFEIRDQIMWLYGSGFPKSMDVSKAIDKLNGVKGTLGEPKSAAHAGWIERGRMRGTEGHDGYQRPWMDDPEAVDANARQYIGGSETSRKWSGWGTALKPAHEPICVARKPLIGTVAKNVLEYGTGALNIEECRVSLDGEVPPQGSGKYGSSDIYAQDEWTKEKGQGATNTPITGRWPANIIHDGSEEVLECFPAAPGQLADVSDTAPSAKTKNCYSAMNRTGELSADKRYTDEGSTNFAALPGQRRFDSGSAARFFYTAKASRSERGTGNDHPTVKPLALMQYLCRLICPDDGIILDPFTGSGTTLLAAKNLNFKAIGIEKEERYIEIAIKRLEQDVMDF
jgi:DNA modification methylase